MSSINHPSHYNQNKNGIEVIDIIEGQEWGEGFNRGNAVKYILRAGKKDPSKEIEDLEKARWYLNREINRLRANNEKWPSYEKINKVVKNDEEVEDRIWENGVEIK